ncbi:MAG TPA: GTPase ObgE [Candidatus Dormibacteraeota bacterium]|nr:GTPase ObgE [Candidatus Dormibacteraeota bacterium]
MFADKVEIEIQAGKGGDGRVNFRHEKYRAMGGPDGGDGGRGGNVVFEADHNLNTLAEYRRKRKLAAGDGQPGGSNRKHGKAGEDVIIKVPQGTTIWDGDQLLGDLAQEGMSQIIAHGGRGGFGNAHFTASARQAPRAAELGEPGEHRQLTLELKLVADVGLVGLPNAGKSTLLSVISNAKPEIADYPFTTLIPNLGVVDFRNYSFLVADIPGLIEGASQGKGLGDEFLRHIERTAVILHLIDATSEDVISDYKTIMGELSQYKIDLTGKPQLVILTKADAVDKKELESKQKAIKKAAGQAVYTISAPAHTGLSELLAETVKLVKIAREQQAEARVEAAIPVIDEATQPDLWQVISEGEGYRIEGQKIESFATRTDWSNDASVERLRDILRKVGVTRELDRQGINPGDIVHIGHHKFTW